jgi:anti-sigma regulatory factor (Ser/Thr protein kinase)
MWTRETVVAIDQVSAKVTNELPEISRLADRIDAFCHERNIHGRVAYRFNLVLDEVLTNIISYGFPEGGRHEIEVKVFYESSSLTASISDDGAAFDPLSRAAPDIHAGIEGRKVGGLGIHLLRKLTDSADYRRADGRNHLTFRMRTDATS